MGIKLSKMVFHTGTVLKDTLSFRLLKAAFKTILFSFQPSAIPKGLGWPPKSSTHCRLPSTQPRTPPDCRAAPPITDTYPRLHIQLPAALMGTGAVCCKRAT